MSDFEKEKKTSQECESALSSQFWSVMVLVLRLVMGSVIGSCQRVSYGRIMRSDVGSQGRSWSQPWGQSWLDHVVNNSVIHGVVHRIGHGVGHEVGLVIF